MEFLIIRYVMILWMYVSILTALVFATLVFFLRIRIIALRNQKQSLEEKVKSLEIKTQSLELETIMYKLNPHLFKNILNSIQSHAYQTYYSLDKLANVLDYILYESNQQFVSLREEIEFALSFIEINRLKISPLFDLRIKNGIDPNAALYEEKLIAPLITVDLIENAFKHANLQSAESFISIVFDLKENVFSLLVSNKTGARPSIRKSNSGFGRESLKKRLEYYYNNSYQLDQLEENDTYIAQLKINLLEHKTKMHTAG